MNKVSMVSLKSEKSNGTNKYNPIIYFLIVLLKYDESKKTKSYHQIKKYLKNYNIKVDDDDDDDIPYNEIKDTVNNDVTNQLSNLDINDTSNANAPNFKIDIIDIIYICIDEYGLRIVNTTRLITIKNYYCKTVLNNHIVNNIFILLNLGYIVFNEKEWYKFTYTRNGWEIISIYDLAKEINLHLVNNLTKLCLEYNFSLQGLTSNLSGFLSNHVITYNNLEQFETFFHTSNFIYRMDKHNVLRFEDCVYDLNINKARPGRPNEFCLKSTNYNYNSKSKDKIPEVKQFLKDIFVEDELINYILKIIASTLFIYKFS